MSDFSLYTRVTQWQKPTPRNYLVLLFFLIGSLEIFWIKILVFQKCFFFRRQIDWLSRFVLYWTENNHKNRRKIIIRFNSKKNVKKSRTRYGCVFSHTYLSIGDFGDLLFISKYTITHSHTHIHAPFVCFSHHFSTGRNMHLYMAKANTGSSCNKITFKSIGAHTFSHSPIHPHMHMQMNTQIEAHAQTGGAEYYWTFEINWKRLEKQLR